MLSISVIFLFIGMPRQIKLSNVDLVGINRITSSTAGYLRRLIWCLLLVSGTIYTLYFTGGRILIFTNYPVRAEVTTTHKTPLELPSITVCVRDKYDFHSLMALWNKGGHKGKLPPDAEYILLSNYTVEEIWRQAGYQHSTLVDICMVGPGRQCSDNGIWTQVFTRYGLCHTFSDSNATMSGPYFGLYLKLGFRNHPYGIPFSGFLIGIHDQSSPASHFILNGYECTVKAGNKGRFALISYKIQERSLLDRSAMHCDASTNYNKYSCRLNCLNQRIATDTGCRLPNMDVDFPLCKTASEVKETERLIFEMDIQGGFDYQQCNCLQACRSKFFYWHADTTWRRNKNSIIKVYQDEPFQEALVETWAYGLSSLTGDVGGIFGIMLGASALTLIQVSEVLVSKIFLFKDLVTNQWKRKTAVESFQYN